MPAEERRLVTVLFADVTGSTALGEQLDVEDIGALMSSYFTVAKRVIEPYGGTVQKFIGDAVMAVFGLPQSHGDDAERALEAALALRRAVAEDPALSPLRPHLGINTGEVMATAGATPGEWLVTGDPVNTAARLEQVARPEQVLVGEATRRAAPDFAYGKALDLELKGKAHPVLAWPLLGRLPHRTLVTPFFGREGELDQLRVLARRAFVERQPQLLTLTAPAGTGKSRLLQEFLVRLTEEHPGLRSARALCPPYGQTLTYWPMRSILLGLRELDDRTSLEQLHARLVQSLGGDDHAERDASLIVMTVAPEEQSEWRDRNLIFAAWRNLIERAAQETAVVLIFEDLQWGAESLLDLVDYLIHPRVGVSLLLMAVARPELLDRRPGWGGGRRNHTQLSLAPLGDGHIASLVTHLLGLEPSEAIRSLIVGRAEGNPFFAGELVRTLRDRGSLDLVDQEDVTQALAALPETVHATLLARLDLLSQEERAILQAGAVSGRSFDPEILNTLLPDVSNVHATLDRLVDKDLIVPTTGDRYSFRHILIREVAYQTLPRTRRADDHVQVARHLETTAGDSADRLAGLIALHYLEATRLRRGLTHVPPSTNEEVRAKAIAWLSRAARIDAAAGASVEAAAGLRGAISIATPDQEMLLQEQLSEVFFHGTEALSALERALALWRELRGTEVAGARLLARYLIAAQRWWTVPMERRPSRKTVERLNQEALDLARRGNDERVIGMVLVARAFSTYARPPQALALLEGSRDEALEAATIFERLDDPHWLSASLDALAFSLLQRGDFEEAFRVAGDRLRLLDRIPDVVERVDALCMAALTAAVLGRLSDGVAALQRALAIRVVGRALHIRLHALAFAVLLWTMRGDWEEAVRAAHEGLDDWSAGACAIVTRGMAAGLYAARRRGTEATIAEMAALIEDSPIGPDEDPRIPITRALTRAVAHDDPSLADEVFNGLEAAGTALPAAERALALLAAHRRAPVPVERLSELLHYTEERHLAPITAQLLRLRSAARGGDIADLTRAQTVLRTLDMRPDAALVTCELAALTGNRQMLEEARRDLAGVGDQVGLRRLAEVESTLTVPRVTDNV